MNEELLKTIITALLSSGVVAGLFSYLNKRTRSPESQNDLARIGNDFAASLLEQAKEERAELRLSIKDLEKSNDVKQETIDRLNKIMKDKDSRIQELEALQLNTARKLKFGEIITLRDIFGGDAPSIAFDLTEQTP